MALKHPEKNTYEPTTAEIYRAAKSYVRAGISLIPIRADGSKSPACERLPRVWCEDSQRYRRPWRAFKERLPTLFELSTWFEYMDEFEEFGMAAICGAISGNLEIVDLDNWGIVKPWMKLVRRRAPGLLERLVRVKTPRPGLHVYYRCATIGRSQKLARIPDPDQGGKKPKTLIEVKGEGGYCLAPPSPAACHKSGKCYRFIGDKDLTDVSTITPAEREILFACARELNTWVELEKPEYRRRGRRNAQAGGRPGDDFNARADWADILTPHGWVYAGKGGDGCDLWRRPGKDEGVSAMSSHDEGDALVVFTTNAPPLEEWHRYTKFSAYAFLEHGGDFRAAAAALSDQGYGDEQASTKRQRPFARYAGYRARSHRKSV